jgi:hypothetical protein
MKNLGNHMIPSGGTQRPNTGKQSGFKHNKVSIREIFLGLQDQMNVKLSQNKAIFKHPVAKGDASELEWIELLKTYLPTRYRVEKAFIIDYRGMISDQIDIVIFDRHYFPFMLRQNGQSYIPIESVYGAIEVRPQINGRNLRYAAGKIASVRTLERTNEKIIDKGKVCAPREPTHIFGGILAIDGSITPKQITKLLNSKDTEFLDIGCSLGGNAFYAEYTTKTRIELSYKEDSLIFFFLKLLQGLQSVGTVAPMQISKYACNLKSYFINK